MFNLFDTEEKKIKRAIYKRAEEMAKQTYEKDVMFRSLQASDLHYAIIEDLMKAAKLTGEVEIKLKDGSVIKIKNDEARSSLSRLDEQLF